MKQCFIFDYTELATVHCCLDMARAKLLKMRKSTNRDSALFWVEEALGKLVEEETLDDKDFKQEDQ